MIIVRNDLRVLDYFIVDGNGALNTGDGWREIWCRILIDRLIDYAFS
jgi:hypothetical protein